ncbi:glycosyltransferase family 2 protein [Ferruginibacter sp. SUN106]|uniref:glycosyltransferase family 2 protein n=1 Tax=Ferruginibacter sp. SUN106 TaxID=2978348 RepID=UPI003D36950B
MPGTELSSKVSIVMPTCNRATYILETIESIRNQTYPNWELIIMDDGSDDNTEELIYQLNDKRILFYSTARTGNISKLRKAGIDKTTGSFIAFIDSDDIWAATKLKEQVAALHANEGAGFCVTGGFNFIRAGEPVDYFYTRREGMKYGDLFTLFFRSELSGYLQALLFRRSCMDVAPFKETDSDIDFIVRLAHNFKGIILYTPLFFRRIHDKNYSHFNWEKNYHKYIRLIQEYKKSMTPELLKEASFSLYINFGEDCLSNKAPGKAIRNFFKAWANKPLSMIPAKKTAKAMLQYLR